jgi:formylglycine-generating enzyme required for sulfatase activity
VKINTRNADGKPKEWLMGFKAYDSTDTNRGCFRTNTRMFLTKFAQDYFIGKYEVRQRDFKALMGFNPSYQRCAHCPVESVTWFQALLFANKLSEKFGLEQCFRCRGNPVDSGNFYCELKEKYRGNKGRNYYKCPGYRLPTAAEWEYMARLEATRQPFCKTVGNVAYPSNRKEYERQYCPFGMSGDAKAAPLCYPNSLGVYDLYLSVREWVWDGYSHNHHDFVDGTVTNYAGLQPTPTSSCFHCVVNDYPSGKQCFPCVRELRGFHYLTVGNHKGSETLRFFWHVAKLTRDIQRKSPARVVGFRVARSILTSTP